MTHCVARYCPACICEPPGRAARPPALGTLPSRAAGGGKVPVRWVLLPGPGTAGGRLPDCCRLRTPVGGGCTASVGRSWLGFIYLLFLLNGCRSLCEVDAAPRSERAERRAGNFRPVPPTSDPTHVYFRQGLGVLPKAFRCAPSGGAGLRREERLQSNAVPAGSTAGNGAG